MFLAKNMLSFQKVMRSADAVRDHQWPLMPDSLMHPNLLSSEQAILMLLK